MSIQWVGIGPFALLMLQLAFTLAGLFLLYKTINIIALSFEKNNNSKIFRPMYFLLSFSLIGLLYQQAIDFKMIRFTFDSTEFFINLGLAIIHAVVALWLLFKILKDSKAMKINKGNNHEF